MSEWLARKNLTNIGMTPQKNSENGKLCISCNPAAQQEFNRALALLHSFHYVEAEQAFTEIRASDPDCAMAYWGIAMRITIRSGLLPPARNLRKGEPPLRKQYQSAERANRRMAILQL